MNLSPEDINRVQSGVFDRYVPLDIPSTWKGRARGFFRCAYEFGFGGPGMIYRMTKGLFGSAEPSALVVWTVTMLVAIVNFLWCFVVATVMFLMLAIATFLAVLSGNQTMGFINRHVEDE